LRTDCTEIYTELHRGDPQDAVATNQKELTVFWEKANEDRTAAELLNEASEPHAGS
jgi:hypothetical protein